MNQRKTFISLLFGMCALVATASSMAENNIKINHAATTNETGSIVLSISIENQSNLDLINATLLPTGSEFTVQENTQIISIGDLSINGLVSIDWVANTTYPVSFFQSGLPIFFHIKATNSLGEDVHIPVQSFGGSL